MSTANNIPSDPASDRRVQRILARAQQEMGVRDVVIFGIGRAWSVMLIVGAVFSTVFVKWQADVPQSSADGESNRD